MLAAIISGILVLAQRYWIMAACPRWRQVDVQLAFRALTDRHGQVNAAAGMERSVLFARHGPLAPSPPSLS